MGRMRGEALAQEVLRLKRERNAVILAHSYQLPEVQEVADFVGDSLGLAREAQRTRAEVIVFCGVHFMAETAAILNPEKTVLLPDLEAGCSLADSIRPEDVRVRDLPAEIDEATRNLTRLQIEAAALAVKRQTERR